jgi:hypothetical protein
MVEAMPVNSANATGPAHSIFADIEETLGISTLPRALKSLAEIPEFLEIAWNRTKPSLRTADFERNAAALRSLSGRGVKRSYFTADHAAALERAGLLECLPKTRQAVSHFDALNPRLLLVFAALRLALEDPVLRQRAATFARPLAVAPHAGDGGERGENDPLEPIYRSVRETLSLNFTPDEFQAFSEWPVYLEYAWNKQKAYLKGSRFAELRAELIQEAAQRAGKMGASTPLSASELKAAGLTDPQAARAKNLVCAFSDLLPTLMLIVSTLKVGLGMPVEPA